MPTIAERITEAKDEYRKTCDEAVIAYSKVCIPARDYYKRACDIVKDEYDNICAQQQAILDTAQALAKVKHDEVRVIIDGGGDTK